MLERESTQISAEAEQAIKLLEHFASCAGLGGRKTQTVGKESAQPERPGVWQPDLRYRSLVERLPVVTFMASLDERMQELYVSPQIETLLGFTQEEWLDNPILWYRQLHPDDRDRWVEEFARTCATGANFRAEYRLLNREGQVVWVQGECQVIRDDDGRPLFLQGIAFDITHLKNAAQVEEAKLAAEAASRAKSEFLARMSHEIRTPLNGVVGMIDLLLATGMSENQQRYAQLAREAADALMCVINDILDFSKIEAGKVEIESVGFDLHKLIEDLTELLGPIAAKKDLALASMIRPDVPRRSLGDPNRIRQVLTNLINNALKFTSRGSVSIRAHLERSENGSDIVKVTVEDTGIGIPADRLDRLFKSFSQVDSSTTRKYGGTGLGLAISKRLVELMGGEIGIESKLGVGTKFWFTLKLITVASTDESDPAEKLRSVRVLAVENHPVYRDILAEQIDGLFSAGSSVVDIKKSLQTLKTAAEEKKPYDVVLLPMGSDSEPIRAAIQADQNLQKLKLIAVADLDDTTDQASIEGAGFRSRLHRPVTQSKLVDVVAAVTVQPTSSVANDIAVDARDGLAGLHLLVAEDNEMNQFVTEETLRRAGCTCDMVADGALALEAFEKKQYDAILMDCQMPGMDGLEATARIRQREEAKGLARIPIIALTAEAISGDREKCISAGMDDYVTKPINAVELFTAIASLVRRPLTEEPPKEVLPSELITHDQPIDVEALLSRCMKDSDFAIQTLEKFRDRAANDIQALQRGLAAGDGAGMGKLAHNLKAVAAHVAAAPVRKIAYEIEQAGAKFDAQFMEQRLRQLDGEIQKCIAFIPTAIESLKSEKGRSCKS